MDNLWEHLLKSELNWTDHSNVGDIEQSVEVQIVPGHQQWMNEICSICETTQRYKCWPWQQRVDETFTKTFIEAWGRLHTRSRKCTLQKQLSISSQIVGPCHKNARKQTRKKAFNWDPEEQWRSGPHTTWEHSRPKPITPVFPVTSLQQVGDFSITSPQQVCNINNKSVRSP